MKELAKEDRQGTPFTRRMVKAMNQIAALKSPCWRNVNHDLAKGFGIIEVAGVMHAVCKTCALADRLEKRLQRQRETRAAMRARGRR